MAARVTISRELNEQLSALAEALVDSLHLRVDRVMTGQAGEDEVSKTLEVRMPGAGDGGVDVLRTVRISTKVTVTDEVAM